jgi:NADH:ubiquinone oxidoreductase subunit 5 (subunit L)/multisubunit Na+/H+ antiporter MnhA subunit
MLDLLVPAVILLPLSAALLLALNLLLVWRFSEAAIQRLVVGSLAASTAASLVMLWHWMEEPVARSVHMYRWIDSGEFSVNVDLRFDGLSCLMALLVSGLSLLAARFSVAYLHAERRFGRFFMILALFVSAMGFVALADNYLVLFLGWELAGLCSYLLIAFYDDRPKPARNGLRAFVTNRIGDAAFLAGIFVLYGNTGAVTVTTVPVDPGQASIVALCLLTAAAAKSAQLPFTGWLPRAMEGPTPSSALFYGGVMVSAGVFLLLRSLPIFETAPQALAAAALVGALTALYATALGCVQTEIKARLGYSSVAQLGLMFLAFGLGEPGLALFHMVAHTVLKMHLFLTAPSILHHLHTHPHRSASGIGWRWLPGVALWGALALGWTLLARWGFPWFCPGSIRLAPPQLAWMALILLLGGLILLQAGARSAALYHRARQGLGLDGVIERLVLAPFGRLSRGLWRFDLFLERQVAMTPAPQEGLAYWLRQLINVVEGVERRVLGPALGIGFPRTAYWLGSLAARLERVLALPLVILALLGLGAWGMLGGGL